jgi:hypothetical protein
MLRHFFAFNGDSLADYVSIFVFSEMPLGIGGGSAYSEGSGSLPTYLLSTAPSFEGHIPRTIVRHENQQAEHTLFIKLKNKKFVRSTRRTIVN